MGARYKRDGKGVDGEIIEQNIIFLIESHLKVTGSISLDN